MKHKQINGDDFRAMIINGYNNLCNREKEINAMNVFPVSDGDTGINMRTTLENGIKCAAPDNNLGEYLKSLTSGMLWGARGNSGVILSQLFKGIYDELQSCSTADAGEMHAAFTSAYKSAYSAIVHPVEGTILTVAREGIERAVGKNECVEDVMTDYLGEMRKSYLTLPDMLPVLKEAGVMDSGALGYIVIVDGMLKALNGEKVEIDASVEVAAVGNGVSSETGVLDKSDRFTLGYCTEFLLQLLDYKMPFHVKEFTRALESMGDSLIVIEQDGVVKVHIHTLTPSKALEEAQRYGEFTTVKIENMQLQHSEFIKNKAAKPRKRFAIVAVAEGDGITGMYKDCGADIVISGGHAMGVSASEFCTAYKNANADCIVVLPNNGNNVKAAEQAITLFGEGGVTVLPTQTVIEGYYALANGTSDIEDAQTRISAMSDGIKAAVTVSVARSLKNYNSVTVSCKAGDMLGFIGKKPVCAAQSVEDAFVVALKNVKDISDKSGVFIIKGCALDIDEDALAERIDNEFGLSCEFVYGGQTVYDLIAGVM
ncbi:MAG: DAK2 domain-containing protein [Clostridiales bacterium]|nr:DAK2 domain-containing protein [Clostridiales bacterium]